uniref:Pyruvate kinase n=1 Tax=Oryza brachyantha TaxID=4533 RepID=J3MDU2_ORYBR
AGIYVSTQAREFLSKLSHLTQIQIFVKIENVEGVNHFDEILKETDDIILLRGNLGIDLPTEKVFLFQKSALHKSNMAGKPAVCLPTKHHLTCFVDNMTDKLRPTRAEAMDVANGVLDGSDAILLGADTLRALYPAETVSIVDKILQRLRRSSTRIYTSRRL